MDTIVELFFELIFELIFEGATENIPWIPLPVRILLVAVLLTIYAGLVALLIYVGIINHSILLVSIGILILVMVAYIGYKKYNEYRERR